jgi:hypothetical protein
MSWIAECGMRIEEEEDCGAAPLKKAGRKGPACVSWLTTRLFFAFWCSAR